MELTMCHNHYLVHEIVIVPHSLNRNVIIWHSRVHVSTDTEYMQGPNDKFVT